MRYKHHRDHLAVIPKRMGYRGEGPRGQGGFTVAALYPVGSTDPVALGVAYCHPQDQFSRPLGRRIALGRALKALEARPDFTCRCGAGHAYGETCQRCGEDYYDSEQMAEASA